MRDENDRLLDGTLPTDPEEGAVPMSASAGDPWDEPVLFDGCDVSPFPIHALPAWLAQWASEQATEIQTPTDLPALLGLSVLSLAVSKKFEVAVRPGWREPLNLYVTVALGPGEGKSPVFSAATAPLREWEKEQREILAPRIADDNARKQLREARIKELIARAAKAKSANDRETIEKELRELAAEDAAAPRAVVEPRLYADDVTTEAASRILSEQGGRLGIFSSESGPLEMMAGRYSEGPNFELYLKAHSGDTFHLDRINRPSIHLEAPLLTIAITVQRSVIAALAATPTFRGLGLLARFLYSMPTTMVGKRDPNPAPASEEGRCEYARRIRDALNLGSQSDARGEIVSQTVALTEEAYAALVEFKTRLEPRLGDDGDLHEIADWGNKLAGLTARIAGVLHLADGGDAVQRPIAHDTFMRAVDISTYALAHARFAFGLMGESPAADLAKHIWTWALRGGTASVTKRDIHRAMQARAPRVRDLDPAIEILIERFLFRERPDATVRAKGRPASPIYDINPLVRQGHK